MTTTGVGDELDLGAPPIPRPVSFWVWAGAGLASALVGLLPWIVTGARLPLQNLWDVARISPNAPITMPIALLPLNQYTITLVAGIIIVGSATAGIIALSTRPRQGRSGLAGLTIGLFLLQLLAAVQSVVVIANGLRPGRDSLVYLVLVVAVAAVSILVGAAVFVLIARMPRAGALVGLGIAALATVWWIETLVFPSQGLLSPPVGWIVGLLRWLPAILGGVAIVWCGTATIGRTIAAVFIIVLIAVVPALVTAVTSAVGMRVLARNPSEMIAFGRQVFPQALFQADPTMYGLLIMVFVAAAGLVIKRRRSRARASSSE